MNMRKNSKQRLEKGFLFDFPDFHNVDAGENGDYAVRINVAGQLSIYPILDKDPEGVYLNKQGVFPKNRQRTYSPPGSLNRERISYDNLIVLKRERKEGYLVGREIQERNVYALEKLK
jgi:hypothetical protein